MFAGPGFPEGEEVLGALVVVDLYQALAAGAVGEAFGYRAGADEAGGPGVWAPWGCWGTGRFGHGWRLGSSGILWVGGTYHFYTVAWGVGGLGGI